MKKLPLRCIIIIVMMKEIIKNNLNAVYEEVKNGNNLGEKITVIGATKYVESEQIKVARDLGLTEVGDNKVQEFRDKTSKIDGLNYHFIGRLQKNKVKYLIGKVKLIQSVDSLDLAEEISKQSVKLGVVTDILMEINSAGEESKGGVSPENALALAKEIAKLDGVHLKGIMAMLPFSDDNELLQKLCLQMRELYDTIKKDGFDFEYLSMGMSGDYKIAIKNGSNMIRLGTVIFGERDYTKKVY